MFSFIKNKPTLKDLIPEGYIDIHSHVLFGIDDGAQLPDDSEFLMQSMIDMGFSKCIATPHTIHSIWDNTTEIINSRLSDVKEIHTDLSSQLDLKAASEYLMDHNFLERLQTEPLLTLKDNYVLVEMSYINPPIQLFDILYELKLAGYIPVLAHPERYLFYHNNLTQYDKLKKTGCLFQLNLLATVGYYGEGITKTAEYLLKKGMYDFTGSDIHHNKHVASFGQKIKIKDRVALKEIMNNNLFFSPE
ncbi:MAG: tyrosine-protein phosphatase [Flavobacterium sp.]